MQTFGAVTRREGGLAVRRLRRQRDGSGQLDCLVDAFQDLGATYVKLGQLLGSAPGLFGPEVSLAFRRLLDTGPPVPFREVRAIIEADLALALDAVFSQFDESPMAAASIAVVHRATLIGGREVAVKVLRPGIAGIVEADLSLLGPLIRFFARQGIEAFGPLLQFFGGLHQQIAEELDLRNEASAMSRFRALYLENGLDRLVIPEVFAELSGPHVLTMDLLDGVPVDAAEDDLGANARSLILQLLKAWLITAIRDGVFHGDLHAGNLLLLRDGRLGVIDWGIVGRLDPVTHWTLRRVLEGCMGDESAWLDVAEVYRAAGVTMQDDFGLSSEQAAALVRAQLEPILTQPLGEVDLTSIILTSKDVMKVTQPTGARPTLRQRVERVRGVRSYARRQVDERLRETVFDRANFMLGKQLMYVERFGKMYLSDVALLDDRDLVAALLTAEGPPSPLSGTPRAHRRITWS